MRFRHPRLLLIPGQTESWWGYEAAGQPFDYRSCPRMGHSMHGQDPALFATTLTEWAAGLPGR